MTDESLPPPEVSPQDDAGSPAWIRREILSVYRSLDTHAKFKALEMLLRLGRVMPTESEESLEIDRLRQLFDEVLVDARQEANDRR